MDWNDPTQRAALIDRIGVDAYNRAQTQHFADSTVETVNGHAIRIVGSRFGRVYMVDGTGRGHATLEGARKIARGEL
jgi:type IV secretory pathway protease TraF